MGWQEWDRTTRVGVPILAVAVVVAAALLVGLFAGWWGPNKPDPPPPTSSASGPTAEPPSPTSGRSSPTPTPSPTSTEPDEEEAVRQAVLEYYEIYNEIATDPNGDPGDLEQVAAGELLESYRGEFQSWRARGWKQTGEAVPRNIVVGTITTEGTTHSVLVSLCADVSNVDLVDDSGESQVADGRPDRFNKLMWLESVKEGPWLPIRERDGGDACDE